MAFDPLPQPPPTWAPLQDPDNKDSMNPVWLDWFVRLTNTTSVGTANQVQVNSFGLVVGATGLPLQTMAQVLSLISMRA